MRRISRNYPEVEVDRYHHDQMLRYFWFMVFAAFVAYGGSFTAEVSVTLAKVIEAAGSISAVGFGLNGLRHFAARSPKWNDPKYQIRPH